MPTRPLSYCSSPGCSVRVRSGACPAHDHQRVLDQRRGSAASRGYDHAWRTFRLRVLRQNPVCTDCKAAGYIAWANELHHIVKVKDDPSRRLDASNVLPLCQSCHSKRTARGE